MSICVDLRLETVHLSGGWKPAVLDAWGAAYAEAAAFRTRRALAVVARQQPMVEALHARIAQCDADTSRAAPPPGSNPLAWPGWR